MSFYQTLLSVQVEHAYYSNKLCPCLDFHPTAETRRIFDNTGLLFKPTAQGIQVVYDEANPQALELYAQEPMSFDFRVFSSSPDFRAFTEPFDAEFDGLLYIDNNDAPRSDDTGRVLVPAARFIPLADIETAENQARRKHELKKRQQSGSLDKAESKELSGLEARGSQERQQDSVLLECGELLSQRDRLRPPDLLLRIFAQDSSGSLLQTWRERQTTYLIEFENRRRYWKYYLLGSMVNEDNPSQDLYIAEAERRFKFETLGEERLPDRSLAYTFRSEQPIPLKESYLLDDAGVKDAYQYEFRLMKKGQDETPLINRLPYASVGRAGMEKVSGQAVEDKAVIVSEIYINS